MELQQYVTDLQRQLVDAAENGSDNTRATAERLAASLDAASATLVVDAIRGLKASGTAVAAVFHDPALVEALADQVVELAPRAAEAVASGATP